MKNPNYDRETIYGEITAVNADGTVDIKPGKCDHDYSSVPVPSGGTFQVGDGVVVGFYYRNRNMPFVLSKGSANSKSAETVVVYSSLNWDLWRVAQYRGGYNNTNQRPTIANTEVTLLSYTDSKYIQAAKVHSGYIYAVEYYDAGDWRLYRLSLAGGSREYATGGNMTNNPLDMAILTESEVPYAYVLYQYGDNLYLAKYNLSTMARVYSQAIPIPYSLYYRRLFYDATYIYVIWDYSGTSRQRGFLQALRSTGVYQTYYDFAWPDIDYQTDNGYLCLTAEIRQNMVPVVGGGVVFPQNRYISTSQVQYQVPAFNLDGSLKWTYAPTSYTLSKQWFSYVVEWYCSSIEFTGCYFNTDYNTANTLFYFTDRSSGDKQIRNTLIACNDTYAVVLAEETTITQNTTYRSYDDWQQTVWKATWDGGLNFEVGRRNDPTGQGAPGQYHADLIALKDAQFASFDSLAFDSGDPIPFQWVSRKEVFLRVLNISTGELVTEYGFSASESDTGAADDITISRFDLITNIRTASAEVFITRTKEDYIEYSGPGYRDLMGLADDEYPKNAVAVRILDYWEADWDPETSYDHVWWACLIGYGSGGSLPMRYDEIAAAQKGNQVAIQEANFYQSTPTGPGTWYYMCVAVKHPAADVVLHTEKYVPTRYDWTKSLITGNRIFFAPSGASGRLGCFQITDPAAKKWDCNVGPGAEYLHMCCGADRVYYFRGTDRTNCTLYEISMATGTIMNTKTGVSVCDPTTSNMEPMLIDNKIVLADTLKLSYIGQ